MITLGSAVSIYARLSWLRLRRGRLLWVCAALCVLPLVGTAALMLEGNGRRDLYDNVLEIYYRFLIPFVPALLCSSVLSEELDARTYTFVFARPAPRAALVLGKYLAITGAVGATLGASIALSWLVAMLRVPSEIPDNLTHLVRTEAGALLGVAGFGALACAMGSLFLRHPFLAVMIYLAVVEAGLGSAPLAINVVALSWHLRNLADLPRPNVYFVTLQVAPLLSALVAAAWIPLGLGIAALRVRDAEYAAKS